MASTADDIAILDSYFKSGGELSDDLAANSTMRVENAMSSLMADATGSGLRGAFSGVDFDARRQFAQHSIFERTLNPPSIMTSTFVRPSIQVRMLEPLYATLTGGFWSPPDPSGISSWIGSEAGGRAYFVATLSSPPRIWEDAEIELAPEVLALLLKIVRDAALPVSWFGPLQEQQVFKKIEGRISAGEASITMRRTLLALNSQAEARVTSELAKMATAGLGAFQAFPGGDGVAMTVAPPPAKRWWRNGYTWLGAGAGLLGGVTAARYAIQQHHTGTSRAARQLGSSTSYRLLYLAAGKRSMSPEEFPSVSDATRAVRFLKARGLTAWVEDETGRFVPVEGAKRKPRGL